MAPKIMMVIKTLLSFKICVFNYFFQFLQDCLKLANCSLLQTQNFSLKFKMAEKFNMADFLPKIFVKDEQIAKS
jgi:hypothetical protein